jgi:hypothetical protein
MTDEKIADGGWNGRGYFSAGVRRRRRQSGGKSLLA